MPLKLIAIVIVAFAAFLFASPVYAQSCTYSIDSPSFGIVQPLDNQEILTQATFSATCSGNANATVRVCLHIGGGTTSPREMAFGTSDLYYDIYQNAARTQRWGSVFAAGSGTPTPLFIPLPASAGTPVTRTQILYLKLFSGQQVAVPGPYTHDYANNQTAAQAVYSTTASCPSYSAVGRPAFMVTATVEAGCEVNANPMNFGTHGILNINVDAMADVDVRCTSTTDYAIALGNGQNGSSATTRKMALGGDFIAYGLYSNPGRDAVFGSTAGQTVEGTGSGSSIATPVYGRVPPQDTPPAGTYKDVVVVSVIY